MVVTAIGFAATALGGRFRRYSIVTILVMVGFAAWALKDARRIEAGLATPWVGVIERVSFYSWHLWFIVLALRLLKAFPRNLESSSSLIADGPADATRADARTVMP